MRRQFWTIVGITLTSAMILLSAIINYQFGYSLGTTEFNARIFGAVSVVAVGMMAVLPLRIRAHWEGGSNFLVVLGTAVFLMLAAYTVVGSIGFGMQNRSQLAGSRETLDARLKDQTAQRKEAQNRLKKLNEDLPEQAIKAMIDAARRDRRWELTQGCNNATAPLSREFCQGLDALHGKRDVAATAAALRMKIDVLGESIERLRSEGAGQIADPQSFGLATILATGQDTIRVGLSILLGLVIESVCCFGLLVVGSAAGGAATSSTSPEWVGQWLSRRVQPNAAARTKLTELETDFGTWCKQNNGPCLSSRTFMRLLRAACCELGLAADSTMVHGLQLADGDGASTASALG